MWGQVYKIHSDFYYVKNSQHDIFICKLKDTLKKQKVEIKVGDFVELSSDNEFISKLLNRKNSIPRPRVSNIDLAFVICSLQEPKLDFIQLNRYLTYFKYHNIETAICFNKQDIEPNLEDVKIKIKSIYEKLGYKLFFISAKNKLDLDELYNYIKNKTVVFCGQSGVGKSTLLNSLNLDVNSKTGSVSTKTKKGCHTTRHSEIFEFDSIKLIDTPGFSNLKFDFLLPEQLVDLFDDISKFKNGCKYSDCLHNVETNGICCVYDNLDSIDDSRYSSYLLFLKETMDYKNEISKKSLKNETFKKEVGNLTMTKISKRKRLSARNTYNQKIRNDHNE